MKLILLTAAFTLTSIQAQAAPDASVEALRGCLLGLDDRAHVSRDLGIAVIGAARARKPGVYSLTPEGYLYFHECSQATGRLEYPRKSSPAQADYALPAGRTIQVVNPATLKPLPPDSWSIAGATVPAAATGCLGVRVKDASATSMILKRIRRLAGNLIFGKEAGLLEPLRIQALNELKRKSSGGELAGASESRVRKFSFTPSQVDQEALRALRAKQQTVASCRDALKASSPEEKTVLADLTERVAAAEWGVAALSGSSAGAAASSPGTGASAGAR